MIRGTATVTYVDGGEPEQLHVIPFDWMRYERYCARNKISADPRESPASWGMYLAYSAWERVHASNGTPAGFDTWAITVDVVDLDVETANPTQPKASDE